MQIQRLRLLRGVNEGHLRATLSFDNGLVVVSATAAELKDLLENGLEDTAVVRTPSRFPHVAGMKFSYDSTMRPRSTSGIGQRVRPLVTLTSDGTVKDTIVEDGDILSNPDRRLNLVTLNFLANGGDDYPFQELSNPNRLNLCVGRVYGKNFDYPSADIYGVPGRSSKFSYISGEQDTLAEHISAFYLSVPEAYALKKFANEDTRIIKLR